MIFRLNFIHKKSHKYWDTHQINRQFKFASLSLLGLIAGVTATSFISLYLVRQKTESAMLKCIELQQLVFQMNQTLEETNELEQGFFQEILTLGVNRARHNHLKEHDQNIASIQEISYQIQQIIQEEHLSRRLHQSQDELLAYDQVIQQYHQDFKQADRLAEDLGSQNVGIIKKNQEILQLLHENLQGAGNPEIMETYHNLIAGQQAYFLTRKSLEKQQLNQFINQLKAQIQQDLSLSFYQYNQAKDYLEKAELNLQKVSVLEENISEISNQFQQESDQISQQLLTLSDEEVKLAHQDIKTTSRQMMVILASAIIAMVTLSTVIWNSFQMALKQLAVEQEKSERLLLNILPETIAQRLKHQPGTIAENFEEVTVLFADIAGFTQLSTQISPTELVNLLNEIFSAFDQITTQKNLEKIKTIGDAYLVVGGLPTPRKDHAIAIAELALEMQTALAEFNQKYYQNLQIRIGINTGPVVAGVIGAKKFIYDLWGDTVNTASRMESHGIIGEIQVTEATYQQLKHDFNCEERGSITVKGKGKMNTYLVKSRL